MCFFQNVQGQHFVVILEIKFLRHRYNHETTAVFNVAISSDGIQPVRTHSLEPFLVITLISRTGC